MDKQKIEQLVIMQALQKVIGEQVDTKNPDSLRSEVDAYYRDLYDETGSKSFDVSINDEVVGNYAFRFSKPKPSEIKHSFEVRDFVKLGRWSMNLTESEIRMFAESMLSSLAEWFFYEYGEMPDGCDLVEFATPETPKQCIGGALRVEPEKVAHALRGSLPQRIAGLLGE